MGGGGIVMLRLGHIIANKSPQAPIYRKLAGLHGRYGRVFPQVIEPPTVQPVAICCMDEAIPAPHFISCNINKNNGAEEAQFV